MNKKAMRLLAGIPLVLLIVIGVLIFKMSAIEKENMQLKKSSAKSKQQYVDARHQFEREYPHKFLTKGKKCLIPYTKNSEKIKEYTWYAGMITEFNYCATDSTLFDDISSYQNPIDLIFMKYLNGRARTCYAERRYYRECYYNAWRKEFYHAAALIYDTIHYNLEKKQVAAYVKAIENMIDHKQDEMVISIDTCNTTPKNNRCATMYYGNDTISCTMEAAAFIYRNETFNLISQYDIYQWDSTNGKTEYEDAPKYKYFITKMKDTMNDDCKIPKYFKTK